MSNGWSGGQYSLFRLLFGTYLFVHFAQLIPWGIELFSNQGVLPEASSSPLIYLFPNILALWDGPFFVASLLFGATGLSALFAVGLYDRAAAVLLWYVWACLYGRNPLISNPSLPYVGWMLLAHAFLPAAPYGSWASRGRPDPENSWRMPNSIYIVAWVLMALGYTYSGYTKLVSPSWLDGSALARILDNPLARPGLVRDTLLVLPEIVVRFGTWGILYFELSFAPLAFFSRFRPWLWGLMLAMHLGLLTVIDFADLSLGMVLLHLFTFDPAWIGKKKVGVPERIFYDGHCGLCHRLVRFVLAEDFHGEAFHFAPLGRDALRAKIPAEKRSQLPDSIVVLTDDGILLTRSVAVLYILCRLGGAWRLLATLAAAIPVPARDWMYDQVARIRHRLFPPPAEACPLVPARLKERFEV